MAIAPYGDRSHTSRGHDGGHDVALGAVLPDLQSAYADQVVRSRIAEMMAAIQPLQRQLEGWFISRSPADAPEIDMDEAQPGAESFAKVNVSLTSGRVRLALGPSIRSCPGARSCSRRRSTAGGKSAGYAFRSTFPRDTCRRSAGKADHAGAHQPCVGYELRRRMASLSGFLTHRPPSPFRRWY